MMGQTTLRPSPDIRRFLRFVAVGLLNTAFGYGVFAVLILLGLGPAWALLWATVAGVLFNFLTTGRLVFASRGLHRLPRFVAVYAVVYGLNAAALGGLLGVGVPPLLAQLIVLPLVVVVTFLAMRTFVFQGDDR